MDVQVQDSFTLTLAGKKVSTTVSIEVEAEPDLDLSALLHAVGARLVARGATGDHDGNAVLLGDGQNGATVRAAQRAGGETGGEARNGAAVTSFRWERPDLHAKSMKSVHRVVDALGKAGGRGLTVQEICERARISPVPAYKLLKEDTPAGAYAARYVRATKVGRSQVVDLTADGRRLASLIRAGDVPA